VFSYLVLPAVAGLLVSQNSRMRLAWGWGMASLASLLGLQIAYWTDMPAAPVIVLTLGALLLLSWGFSAVRRR